MTTGGEKFLKLILVIFNAVFAIGGLISLICGGVALGAIKSGTSGLHLDEGEQSMTGAAGLLVAIGVFVFITAIIGCIAAVRGSRAGLYIYSVILVFILILQLSATIAAFVLKGKVQDFVHIQLSTLRDSVRNDTAKTHLGHFGRAFKLFQEEWKCCGVDGPDDWLGVSWFGRKYSAYAQKGFNLTFPGCCSGGADVCQPCEANNATTYDCVATPTAKASTAIYTTGCTTGFSDYIKSNIGIVAGVALTFGLIQVLGIIISCCLAKSLGSGHERIQ